MLMDPKSTDKTLKVEELIRRGGTCRRAELVEQGHITPEEVTYAVRRLWHEGVIECMVRKPGSGKHPTNEYPMGLITERYVWIGRKNTKFMKVNGHEIDRSKANQPRTTQQPDDFREDNNGIDPPET